MSGCVRNVKLLTGTHRVVKSKGRMIRKDISKSKGIAGLSMASRCLFFMLIPHLNGHGKMNGSPYFVKGEVVPLIDFYSVSIIKKSLKEISRKTNLKWFEYDGLSCIHSIKWADHQDLRSDRLGADELPDYSWTTPGLLHHEVKGEGEVKEEVKVKGEGLEDAPVPGKPKRASTVPDSEWIDSLRENPAYTGIDLDRVLGKLFAWCELKDLSPTRKRFLNWLNREDRPMNGNRNGKPKTHIDDINESLRNFL